MMNNVFCEYLDDFVVYYINDIFIFSKNMEDHDHHVFGFGEASGGWILCQLGKM
jgi:hypothetical protein